jgi:hypothetical protein
MEKYRKSNALIRLARLSILAKISESSDHKKYMTSILSSRRILMSTPTQTCDGVPGLTVATSLEKERIATAWTVNVDTKCALNVDSRGMVIISAMLLLTRNFMGGLQTMEMSAIVPNARQELRKYLVAITWHAILAISSGAGCAEKGILTNITTLWTYSGVQDNSTLLIINSGSLCST